MEQLALKRHIRDLYLLGLLIFIVNKFVFRPFVLTLGDSFYFLKIIAWSLPNFIEAVIGSINITGILLFIKIRFKTPLKQLTEPTIYAIAVFLAGVFVLTQEVKWHNLGGRNVYDPNDFIASILGLLFMVIVFYQYGFRENIPSQ